VTTTTDDEMTELVDADFPRVDLVGKGANGVPRFLIAKQDEASRGLLPPDMIRDLISKAEPDSGSEETVTMTGSPAAIAKLIHEAGQKARADKNAEDIAKAEISTKDKNDLPDSDFAYIEPGGHKDDEGKTVPRDKRHFPIHDAAHVRNALARIGAGAEFGKEALPKVKAKAKELGIDVAKAAAELGDEIALVLKDMGMDDDGPEMDDGTDGMDPTVPLAEPDGDAPGDPTDPGSPAWEAIDAATAMKWTAILSRAKGAVGMLSEREMLESVSADPSDASNAWDLQDVCGALDFAISVLAPFAVAEQAEADCGAAEVAKAMAGFDPAPLDAVEGLALVSKSRELPAGLRADVLAGGGSIVAFARTLSAVAKAGTSGDDDGLAGEPDPAEQARDSGPVKGGGAAQMGQSEPDMQTPEDREVRKAEDGDGDGKPAMVPVHDAHGCLTGVAQRKHVIPVDPGCMKTGEPQAGPAAAAVQDLTPQPAAQTGTPAGDIAKAADPQTTDATGVPDETITIAKAELQSLVTAEVTGALDAQEQVWAAKSADLAHEVEVLKARLKTVEEQPVLPKIATNGALPAPHQMRGQDQSPVPGQPMDVAKAQERRKQLYQAADATEQDRIAKEMNAEAIEYLTAMRSQPSQMSPALPG